MRARTLAKSIQMWCAWVRGGILNPCIGEAGMCPAAVTSPCYLSLAKEKEQGQD